MTRLALALAALVTLGIFLVDWNPAPLPSTTTSSTTTTSTTTTSTTTVPAAAVTDPAAAERALRERGIDPGALSREIAERMRQRFEPAR